MGGRRWALGRPNASWNWPVADGVGAAGGDAEAGTTWRQRKAEGGGVCEGGREGEEVAAATGLDHDRGGEAGGMMIA